MARAERREEQRNFFRPAVHERTRKGSAGGALATAVRGLDMADRMAAGLRRPTREETGLGLGQSSPLLFAFWSGHYQRR